MTEYFLEGLLKILEEDDEEARAQYGTLENMLIDTGHTNIKTGPDGTVYALERYIFTHAIVCGIDWLGYDHRYCYGSLVEAMGAYRDWSDKNFEGEPEGFIKRKG